MPMSKPLLVTDPLLNQTTAPEAAGPSARQTTGNTLVGSRVNPMLCGKLIVLNVSVFAADGVMVVVPPWPVALRRSSRRDMADNAQSSTLDTRSAGSR